MNEIIESFEKRLVEYRKKLEENPSSTFYTGLIKNTEEYIKELKEDVTLHKHNTNK